MAYYALVELHILPSEYVKLSKREKAFIFACAKKKAKAIEEKNKK